MELVEVKKETCPTIVCCVSTLDSLARDLKKSTSTTEFILQPFSPTIESFHWFWFWEKSFFFPSKLRKVSSLVHRYKVCEREYSGPSFFRAVRASSVVPRVTYSQERTTKYWLVNNRIQRRMGTIFFSLFRAQVIYFWCVCDFIGWFFDKGIILWDLKSHHEVWWHKK